MSTAVPAPIGVVGHYNLLERLEPSGPGDLFRARDTRAGRTVAIRLLPPAFASDVVARTRVLDKARTMAVLSHPNVTTLFDAGEHEGRIFLVFEYLKGQPLRAEMAGRYMNVRRALELAVQIADAIAEAHGAGFIHGGLSPDSVVITAKGHAKIPAFELAARSGFDDTGEGLRDYGSPEEANGQEADDRSDIHSVGAVLYEMLTTKRPSNRGAAAPSAVNPRVPKEVDEVVLKAIAPNPDLRYQNAVTLAAELRSVVAIMDVHDGAGDEGDETKAAESTSLGGVLVTAAVLLAAVGAVVWWFLA